MNRTVRAARHATAVGRLEQKVFWRNRSLVVPTFLVPVALCASVPLAVPADVGGYRTRFVTAMVAMIAVYSTFTTVAVTATARRDALILRRLRGTGMTGHSIVGGFLLNAAVLAVGQVALLIAVGTLALGVPAPRSWLLLGVLLGYGTAVFAALAVLYTAVIPNAESAQVLCIPVLFLGFGCSGLFVPLSGLPAWLEAVAQVFPVTALADGVRIAYLGSDGSSSLGVDLAVLGVWWAAGVVGARRWFRWA